MLGAAILRTEKMIGSRNSGFEPSKDVTVRQDVLLHAECRHKEAVNYILRNQRDLHIATDGNMQSIDLSLTAGMLELPHPLLANAINFQRIHRRTFHVVVDDRAPD